MGTLFHSSHAQQRMSTAAVIRIQSCYRAYLARKVFLRRKQLFEKKTKIAQELLDTEIIYVSNLNILYQTFLEPISNTSSSTVTKLFGSDLLTSIQMLTTMVKVILGYHHVLLSQLQQRMDTWRPGTKLGDAFTEMSSYLKTYAQYVTHYQPIVRLLKERKDDPQLVSYLRKLSSADCKGKGLRDFMIMPVQRIPRYSMLLTDLYRKTWEDHLDYATLQNATTAVNSICNHVEEMSAQAVKHEKKMEIAKNVIFPKGMENIVLAAPHRKFVWENVASLALLYPATGKSLTLNKVQVFAFTDLIMFCEYLGKTSKYKVQAMLLVEQVETFKSLTEPNSFLISTNSADYFIRHPDPEHEREFLDQLEELIRVALSAESNEDQQSERRTVQIRRSESADSSPNKRVNRALNIKSVKKSLQQSSPAGSAPTTPPRSSNKSLSSTLLRRKKKGLSASMQ